MSKLRVDPYVLEQYRPGRWSIAEIRKRSARAKHPGQEYLGQRRYFSCMEDAVRALASLLNASAEQELSLQQLVERQLQLQGAIEAWLSAALKMPRRCRSCGQYIPGTEGMADADAAAGEAAE